MTLDQPEKTRLFHLESMRRNIAEIRSWIFQLTIISGGIIGFTLPIFDSSSLVKNSQLLIVGLFLFWFEIVLGFGYLKVRLEKENNELDNQWEEMNKNNEIKPLTKNNTKNHYILIFFDHHILDVLYGIFIVATLMIILSMI